MKNLALVLLVAGCGQPAPNAPRDLIMGTPDLAMMSTPPDMTVLPDLIPAIPPDMTLVPTNGFCDNTTVGGTCVATFMDPVSKCFVPSGACTQAGDGMTFENACWGTGKLIATLDMANKMAHGTWKDGNNVTCMTGAVDVTGPIFTLMANGKTLIYNEKTGDVTCPDGTKINVGPKEGNCAAFSDILEPNVNMCAMGSCS
jgi:hypothetical protein